MTIIKSYVGVGRDESGGNCPMFPSSKTSIYIQLLPTYPQHPYCSVVQAIAIFTMTTIASSLGSASPLGPLQILYRISWVIIYNVQQTFLFILLLKTLQRLINALAIKYKFFTIAPKASYNLASGSNGSLFTHLSHTGLPSSMWTCHTHSFLRAFSVHSEWLALPPRLPRCWLPPPNQVLPEHYLLREDLFFPTSPAPQCTASLHYTAHSNY